MKTLLFHHIAKNRLKKRRKSINDLGKRIHFNSSHVHIEIVLFLPGNDDGRIGKRYQTCRLLLERRRQGRTLRDKNGYVAQIPDGWYW